MTLKNQYLLIAICCTVGCIFFLVEKSLVSFGLLFLAAGIIFPRLRRFANPEKQKPVKTKEVRRMTLANLLLLLLILWVFAFALIRKSDLRALFGGWVFLVLLWLFFMTYLFKCYLIEEAEIKEKENPEPDKAQDKN